MGVRLLGLQGLFQAKPAGPRLPLGRELENFYGQLALPRPRHKPLVVGNFVSSLDGVVSLNSGKSGGGPISGNNHQDRMLMGLSRALADVVMEGAGTLRAAPKSVLTPQEVCPKLGGAYAALRQRLGKPPLPLHVIVSQDGDLDLGLRIFRSGEVPVQILSGARGVKKLASRRLPPGVTAKLVPGRGPRLGGKAMLKALGLKAGQLLLVEGGPQLLGSLLKDRCLDELFLTLAPQVAGRDGRLPRPGFVSGQVFAPHDPCWGSLVSVKKGQNHLFLRYDFSGKQASS